MDGVDKSCIINNTFENFGHFAPDIATFAGSRYYVALAPLFCVVAECLHVVADLPEQAYER